MACHLCIYWTPEKGCDHYGPDKSFQVGNKVLTYEPSGNDAHDADFLKRCQSVIESRPSSLQEFFERLNETGKNG